MSSSIRSEIVLATVLAILGASRMAHADDDPEIAARRERFRAGMEKYVAGRYADAIVVWEAIYREIGEKAGYKLAFDLGRAYDQFGDSTRAAERYEIFVREVERRRTEGAAAAPEIDRWEQEANDRLAALAQTKGRIRVAAGERPTLVRIDAGEARLAGFVAYVAPGRHTVTFGTGADATAEEIDIREGAIVELAPPPPRPPPPSAPPPPGRPDGAASRPPRFETRVDRPFSAVFLYAGAGATVVSVVVPLLTYSSALAVRDDYEAANDRGDAHAAAIASEYESARETAYATVAVPIALGLATAGLATWYFMGSKETRVRIGAGSITGRF